MESSTETTPRETAEVESRALPPLPASEKDLRWKQASRNPRFRLALIVGGIVLLVAGFFLWRYLGSYESTDDAQIDGHLNAISARVSGHVSKLLVNDNQFVEAGTPLVEIDPKDYEVAVARARAAYQDAMATAESMQVNVPITTVNTGSQLSSAQAQLEEMRAGVSVARQQLEAARAQLEQAIANDIKAQNDVGRYKQLVDKQEISHQQYDQAVAAARSSAAGVAAARASAAAAEQQVVQAQAKREQTDANLRAAQTAPQQNAQMRSRAQAALAQAQQKKAELDQAIAEPAIHPAGCSGQRHREQSHGRSRPECSGRPGTDEDHQSGRHLGDRQLQGEPAPLMRPGQRATISVDAYGKKYNGHVESIAGASGALFSLLPPENATGNYVKVVQRIPVKITFDPGETKEHILRPGMSVEPKVWVR